VARKPSQHQAIPKSHLQISPEKIQTINALAILFFILVYFSLEMENLPLLNEKSMTQNNAKAVVITGTRTGIGLATLEVLAAAGFHVYAGVASLEGLAPAHALPNVTSIELDVTNARHIENAMKRIESENESLFGLVNNAGIARMSPIVDAKPELFEEIYQVNVVGTHRITQQCLPLLMKGNGRIVFVSSIEGFLAEPFLGPYVASKFALEGYADVLRRELLLVNAGVKVVVLEPGTVNTPIFRKSSGTAERYTASMYAAFLSKFEQYTIAHAEEKGLPPKIVANGILKVLTMPNPPARKIISRHRFLYGMLKRWPSSIVDKSIVKEFRKIAKNR